METAEGLKITNDRDKMISTYDENYKIQENQYTYNTGKTNLEFIIDNGVMTSIQQITDFCK